MTLSEPIASPLWTRLACSCGICGKHSLAVVHPEATALPDKALVAQAKQQMATKNDMIDVVSAHSGSESDSGSLENPKRKLSFRIKVPTYVKKGSLSDTEENRVWSPITSDASPQISVPLLPSSRNNSGFMIASPPAPKSGKSSAMSSMISGSEVSMSPQLQNMRQLKIDKSKSSFGRLSGSSKHVESISEGSNFSSSSRRLTIVAEKPTDMDVLKHTLEAFTNVVATSGLELGFDIASRKHTITLKSASANALPETEVDYHSFKKAEMDQVSALSAYGVIEIVQPDLVEGESAILESQMVLTSSRRSSLVGTDHSLRFQNPPPRNESRRGSLANGQRLAPIEEPGSDVNPVRSKTVVIHSDAGRSDSLQVSEYPRRPSVGGTPLLKAKGILKNGSSTALPAQTKERQERIENEASNLMVDFGGKVEMSATARRHSVTIPRGPPPVTFRKEGEPYESQTQIDDLISRVTSGDGETTLTSERPFKKPEDEPRSSLADATPSERARLVVEISGMEKRLRQLLKPAIFFSGEYIIHKHDIGTQMYFLSKGKVEVVSSDGQTRYSVINAGSFFGELGVLFDIPRTASVRAMENSMCMVLTRKDLDDVMKDFPYVYERFQKVVQHRMDEVNFKRSNAKHIKIATVLKPTALTAQ